MENSYVLTEYDPVVYMEFIKDKTFNLKNLDMTKSLVSKPILLFNDDERGMFGQQKDIIQSIDNMVKVIAGTSKDIMDQKLLNNDEKNSIIQFIEENGI